MNPTGHACLICLSPEPPDSADGGYHRACLQRLFGCDALPDVRFEAASVTTWWRRSVGKMSISGAQPKATLNLSADRSALLPSERGGAYIVKPPHAAYAHVPENEHLTMCLARLVGLKTAECGLFQLRDSVIAYITRRFDRSEEKENPKRSFVDFCQLADKSSVSKDDGTAEECAALARRYADDPHTSARELFRLFVFSYWSGNGDMHLKNIALLEDDAGKLHLSPAYDLLCTRIYGDTTMCLPLNDRQEDFSRADWLTYAARDCGIPRDEAKSILAQMVARTDDALALVARSPLPDPTMKERFGSLLRLRGEQLTRSSSPPPGAA